MVVVLGGVGCLASCSSDGPSTDTQNGDGGTSTSTGAEGGTTTEDASSKACDQGRADCNGVASDGCEVDVTADALHCGKCGAACSTKGGTPSCVDGACRIACAPGYADCNGDVVDGCESNLMIDPQHCGSCDLACTAGDGGSGGTDVCNNGGCGVLCDGNHANLNGRIDDGCEVDLRTDANNCGTVGTVCSDVPGGTAVCKDKKCGASCVAGYGDCDGDTSNGCEKLDTMTNCGACANACNVATEACQSGACSAIVCASGTANCDSNAANGCETSTLTLDNCGGCNVQCGAPPTNMTVSCPGACSYRCSGGWENCDNLLDNGCEINLNTDPQNCGGCGHLCSFPNAVQPGCSGGACTLGICKPGFANCDGLPGTGCETNVAADPRNCGFCGNRCANACINGVCQ